MEPLTAKELAEILNITTRAVNKRASKEGWKAEILNKRGDRRFIISKLPPDIQEAIVNSMSEIPADFLPALKPGAALAAAAKVHDVNEIWNRETAIGPNILKDKRVQRITRVLAEVDSPPRNWEKGRRKWIEAVALQHGVKFQTIYKWIKKYQKGGLGSLKHSKSNQGQTRSWDPEALDWWIGCCLKRENRKISRKSLYYNALVIEAQRRGWRIGDLRSAYWWYTRKVTPQLEALQRGGLRALDNTLPPILRDYSDLAPFEILVGDQHRFDFWVMDEDTGEVFRPEGYFWQDLRTRAFYGGALDRKYDSLLMGLSLRVGLRVFGAFGSIYTDHGRPEESRYIMGIMKDVRSHGMDINLTTDAPVDLDGLNPEDINPLVSLPGTHRKAIVRNAKAKMIEGTFSVFEGVLRDQFMVPGYVKTLTASGEEQDVDQKEVEALARSGKLLTFREFCLAVFKAMDYYNREKPHRGLQREWAWKPKPKTVVPMDCLMACHRDGWQPRYLSDQAVDLIFLPRAERTVDRGRINFKGERYEHRELDTRHGQRVEIRFDPMDPGWLLVFSNGEYVCTAEPVEYSSMINADLAERKIREKARRRKQWSALYRDLTAPVRDFRQYSSVSKVEKAAALIGHDKQKRASEAAEKYRERSDEELNAEVARIEAYRPRQTDRPLFHSEVDRYQWCLDCLSEDHVLNQKDQDFMKKFEAGMNDSTRLYWETYKNEISAKPVVLLR